MRAQAIKRMLREEVVVTRAGGIDQYGQATPATVVTVPARVVHQHRRSVDPSGVEFISTTQVALLPAPLAVDDDGSTGDTTSITADATAFHLSVGDTITVDGAERPVKSIKRAVSLKGGATLTEAML